MHLHPSSEVRFLSTAVVSTGKYYLNELETYIHNSMYAIYVDRVTSAPKPTPYLVENVVRFH
jgi:hypothetical protein